MPYVIPNPSVQGFQEGAQENMGNMRIAENMLASYINNQAQQVRANDAQTHDAMSKMALLQLGINPVSGQDLTTTQAGKAANLDPYINMIRRNQAYYYSSPQPAWAPVPARTPQSATAIGLEEFSNFSPFKPLTPGGNSWGSVDPNVLAKIFQMNQAPVTR